MFFEICLMNIHVMESEPQVIESKPEDIDVIFNLYDAATDYQKLVAKKHWKGFERSLVEQEIRERRQWKIVVDGQTACVFVLTFNDPVIWKEKDNDPAVYIHRIATNTAFRGHGFVKQIVAWVKAYAEKRDIRFIRMDTGSGNDKLNSYYVSCGFTYLGITEIGEAPGLPLHYKGGSFSLFEMEAGG